MARRAGCGGGANHRCLLIPNAQTNAQAQNQMYKCETSNPQAKGYVPSWYIPLFLGRIFRPEKLLLRRNRVARTRAHRSSILTMQDRQRKIRLGERRAEQRICRTDEKAAVFESPQQASECASRGAVFASLCPRPAKSLPPAPPKLYTGPLLSYNRRDTEIRSAPPAHAAAAPV